jgi:hydrogenase nickel incorporation protein HypA/HybF
MHELSVTRSLLDQALAEAEKHGAKRISRIRLLLGEGGGVVPDCVQFYFDEMKKGTTAADAELEFKRVPLRIRCPKCGAEWGTGHDRNQLGDSGSGPSPDFDIRTSDFVLPEAMCSCNAGGEIVSGQELVIESIDVD